MKISDYYKLSDATYSYTAQRRNIDNTQVSEDTLERIMTLAEKVLEPIYKKYGSIFAISSWYRSPKLNKAVGGAIKSEHKLGSAVDIIPLDITAYELAMKIKKAKIPYNRMILEYKNNKEWIHIQYRLDNYILKQDYTYKNGKYSLGLIEKKRAV